MGLDDRATDGEPQSQAVRLLRHERLEYPFEVRRQYPSAAVGDGAVEYSTADR